MVDVNEARKCLKSIFECRNIDDNKNILTEQEKRLEECYIYNASAPRKHHGTDGEYYTKFNDGHYMLNQWQLIAAFIQVSDYIVWQKDTNFVISHSNGLYAPDEPRNYILSIHTDGHKITDSNLVPDKDGYVTINNNVLVYLFTADCRVKAELDLDYLKSMGKIDYECIDFNENYNQEIDQITDASAFMNYLKCQAAKDKAVYKEMVK